jgi:hypothetical protein
MAPLGERVKAEIVKRGSEKTDYRTLFQNYFSTKKSGWFSRRWEVLESASQGNDNNCQIQKGFKGLS